MSGPGTDVSGELADYLEVKGINALFLQLVENILADKPSNPVQYILAYLVNHYPDMCQVPRVLGYETEDVAYEKRLGQPDSDDEDDDDDDEDAEAAKAKPLHRSTAKRRNAVSAPAIEPEDIGKHMRRRRVPKSKEEIAFLKEVLRRHPLFEAMPPERLHKVVMCMSPNMPEDGKVLYKQDQWDSNALYVIVSGQVNLHRMAPGRGVETVMPYRKAQYFGDVAALYDAPRKHTAKASGDNVKLWLLDRLTMKLTIMEDVAETRARRVAFLMNVPIFATLTELERLALADSLEVCDYDADDIIIRQNDPGKKVYMVEKGRVVVLQQTTPISEPRELCRLDEGAYFGEMALLTDRPRTATVAAAAPETRLLALDRTVFRRLLGPFSKVLRRDKALYNAFMAQKI